jgi:hypothetical protein
MSHRKTIVFVLAICFASSTGLADQPAQQSSGDHQRWQQYDNTRYQYVICYPADIFVPQPEATNPDSRTFLATDGATLTLFGRNKAASETVATMVAEVAGQLADGDATITRDVRTRNWFVISGHRGQQVFYAKGLYAREQLKMFELTYPSSKSDLFEPILRRLSRCFASINDTRRGR